MRSCRSPGALPKTWEKVWVVAEMFLLKRSDDVLHVIEIKPLLLIETSMQTYSLTEECFGYNYGRLKSPARYACREIT